MTLARDYLNRQISVYRNAFDTKEGVDRTVRSVLEDIRDGKLAVLVANVRRLHQAIPALPDGLLPDDRKGLAAWKKADPAARGIWDKASKKYNAAKSRLLPFIITGTFRPGHRHGETPSPKHLEEYPKCCTTGLLEHSGLVIEDLDHLAAHGADLELLMEQFAAHPAVIGAFVSPSDDGLKVIMAVDPVPWDDESHVRGWAGGRDALAGLYTDIDESGKNISRMCYQSDCSGCYIAPDDKVITPARMAEPEPEPAPAPEEAPRAKPRGRSRREATLDEVRAALDYLAAQGVGGDDNSLVAVGTCMKSNGLTFDEFDGWGAAAGCSCTNRRTRWDSFKNSDKDYSAIIGMAVNCGWKKGTGQKAQRRSQSEKGGIGKDSIGLVYALRKLGLEIRFNSRSLKSEVRPITEEGTAIVMTWGKAAQTQPNRWTMLKPAQAANLRARIAKAVKYLADNGQEYRLRFSKDEWRETNLDLSATTYADPFQEWLENLLAWDGLDRWALIFTEGYGVLPGENHTIEYLAHAGKLLVLPCVGRLYEPGAEASTMTVLIGKEGIGKSLGLKSLFPKEWRLRWFSDSIHLRVSDRELLEKVAGFVLLEIGELSGMMRVDQERVKILISCCQDVARLAYREDAEAFPRLFHFCGSANDEGRGVLPDSSENRRFWPINIPADCNRHRVLRWFEANYEQFWAQALFEWKAYGIEAWINPEELEPERLDAAAAQRQVAAGSPDLVDAIEDLDPAMLAKGRTVAELLWEVGAFGHGGDRSEPLELTEVAAKIAAGPGAGVSNAVITELKRRGWTKTNGNTNLGRVVRGKSFWWPPANGQIQNVRMSEVSEGCSRETRCEMGGMNTGSEADNGEDKPRTTPSLETPCQPLTPSDTRSNGDLPYYGPENNICR